MDLIKKYLPEISAVLAIGALLLWGTVQSFRLEAAHNETARVALEFEAYKADQKATNAKTSIMAISKINEDNNYGESLQQQNAQALDALRSELDHSNAIVERLRQQNTRLRAANNTATASDCKAAADRADMLTIVYGECTQRYSDMARIATERGTAGVVCERSYNSIIEVTNLH